MIIYYQEYLIESVNPEELKFLLSYLSVRFYFHNAIIISIL